MPTFDHFVLEFRKIYLIVHNWIVCHKSCSEIIALYFKKLKVYEVEDCVLWFFGDSGNPKWIIRYVPIELLK